MERMLRGIICWMLIAVTPAWVIAADTGAMFYGKGIVLRNGSEIANASAVFSGDLLETKTDAVASLEALGSRVTILPTSLVEFDGQSLTVEHGSVSVGTSHGISVHVGCMTVVPATSAWTQFEVTDVNGTIEVAAKKNDVRLEMLADASPKSGSPKEVSTAGVGSQLREGEQTTRDQSDGCKTDKRKREAGGAVPAGSGGPFTSVYVKYAAIAGVGGLGIWLLLDHDDPPSPYKP